MRKVDLLIKETEDAIQKGKDQLNVITQQEQQIQQAKMQTALNLDMLTARLQTLKEAADLGGDFLAEVPDAAAPAADGQAQAEQAAEAKAE